MLKKNMVVLSALLMLGMVVGCDQGGQDEEETKIPVQVIEIELGQVKQSLDYYGDIRAEFEVKVFSKIPDRIEKYYVDDGDVVQAGDPIAEILATQIEQTVLQAEAYKNNMEMEYSRAQRLSRENVMSQQQFDAIQTQMVQAKAALVSAKSQLKDATLTAPISGIIGKRYFEAGDMAAPSMPVASVVQMDKVKIEFEATEQDLGRLEIGQKAEVQVRSYPDEIFVGKVIKISPILDPMTRMVAVEVLLSNPGYKLKPGMFAELMITTGTLDDVIVVPRHAVIESTSLQTVDGKDKVIKNYYVYVVNDSLRAEQRLLNVDYVNHRVLAVSDGVALGEKLVISGQNNLRDGLAVLIPEVEEVE
ncbi:efflux RND transporter periplasmic adaptor subunit [candidate division KSB1 bacterium]|nr:efflux RND transporter periplasmic adaptor subunit [candidate division KSB1 bacterium]